MTAAPPRVVLASKSTARQALLSGAGVPFEAVSAAVDEEAVKRELAPQALSPLAMAQALAAAKAVETSKGCDGLVIGADQTLDFDGELVGKARNLTEARQRLRSFRGRPHQLHSAVAVAAEGHLVWSNVQSATLSVRDFSDRFLEQYLDRNWKRMMDSVGCYQLEGEGVQLFEAIDGDYFTILGLPLPPLLAFLREQGVLET